MNTQYNLKVVSGLEISNKTVIGEGKASLIKRLPNVDPFVKQQEHWSCRTDKPGIASIR